MTRFNDKEQAQFEHLQWIEKEIVERNKFEKRDYPIVFALFALLGYLGTEVISLSILIGIFPVLIRASANGIKISNCLLEFNRSLCEFDGDLEYLNTRLNVERITRKNIQKFF